MEKDTHFDDKFYEEMYTELHETIHKLGESARKELEKTLPKLESPYAINDRILSRIKNMLSSFNQLEEKWILSNINHIDDYPNMSRYQLSLTKKAMADCYMKHGITGNALEFYEWALEDNKHLPVKRIITSLKSIPSNELSYSLDKNALFEAQFDITVQNNETDISEVAAPDEYEPEFEEFIQSELDKLGEDYRESFYELLQRREFEKDYFFPYKEWVKLTLESLWDSKKASEIHKIQLSKAKELDFNNTPLPTYGNSDLTQEEMLFLQYLHHKKTSLDNIAGYWTHKYHMDYGYIIPKYFSLGFLQYAALEYSLQKSTIAKMTALLPKNETTVKRKKADLIHFILSHQNDLSLDSFKKMYYEITPTGKKYLSEQDYPEKDLSFRY